MSYDELNNLVHDFIELDAEIKQQQILAENIKMTFYMHERVKKRKKI